PCDFLLNTYAHPRDLHSFPTRRSSDLSEAMGAEMSGFLVTAEIDFDEAEAAGYPRNSKPYVITMEQAFTLALINSRFYQFQLERSEEHTSELQSLRHLVCRLLLEKKNH